MRRFDSSPLMLAVGAFLLAGSGALLAQTPTPTPGPTAGPGPWSREHPVWFDMNGDGVPQASEMGGHPEAESTCTFLLGLPSGVGATSTPCFVVYEDNGIGGTYFRPSGLVQELSTNADGTVFTFEEYETTSPLQKGVRALGRTGVKALGTANGTGTLVDSNADGIFDTIAVAGTHNSATLPETQVSLLPRDVTGDGRPDYITVPWTTGGAGVLGVLTDVTPQIYLPLTDTNSDGWPDTVTVRVTNGITTTRGPPVSGSALAAAGSQVPAASTLGLLALAAGVVAIGVKLLRGSIGV